MVTELGHLSCMHISAILGINVSAANAEIGRWGGGSVSARHSHIAIGIIVVSLIGSTPFSTHKPTKH